MQTTGRLTKSTEGAFAVAFSGYHYNVYGELETTLEQLKKIFPGLTIFWKVGGEWKRVFEVGETVYFTGVQLTVVAVSGRTVSASSPTWGSVTGDASGFYRLPEGSK